VDDITFDDNWCLFAAFERTDTEKIKLLLDDFYVRQKLAASTTWGWRKLFEPLERNENDYCTRNRELTGYCCHRAICNMILNKHPDIAMHLMTKYGDYFQVEDDDNDMILYASSAIDNGIFNILMANPNVDPSARDNACLISATTHDDFYKAGRLLQHPLVIANPGGKRRALVFAATNGQDKMLELYLSNPHRTAFDLNTYGRELLGIIESRVRPEACEYYSLADAVRIGGLRIGMEILAVTNVARVSPLPPAAANDASFHKWSGRLREIIDSPPEVKIEFRQHWDGKCDVAAIREMTSDKELGGIKFSIKFYNYAKLYASSVYRIFKILLNIPEITHAQSTDHAMPPIASSSSSSSSTQIVTDDIVFEQ